MRPGNAIVKVLAIFVLCSLNFPVMALPSFAYGKNIEGVWVYPDHSKKNHYYYAPPEMVIAQKNGIPVFGYSIYRFLGTKATRNENEFRIKGVLAFEIATAKKISLLRSIKARLSSAGEVVTLKPMPVKRFESTLHYNTIDSTNATESGVIEGGIDTEVDDEGKSPDEGVWDRRRFTIGLKPLTAQLFWDNFEKESLQLSLSYQWEVEGVMAGNDGIEEKTTKVFANSLPITVSMKTYPDLFRRIESWQKMNASHGAITVLCYDFINEEKSDLYSVTVEIMYENMRGHESTEKLKYFSTDDVYEKQIDFRLAKFRDRPYRYRVMRLFVNGKKEIQDWKEHDGFYLDVSKYN